MIKVYKSLLPFLMMGLFLFPQVALVVHNFNHCGDLHCNDADIHFHTQEHHCDVCDFSIPLTSGFMESHGMKGLNYIFSEFVSIYDSSRPATSGHSFFSLRAPPNVA